MSVERHGLGGRLELLDPDQLSEAQRAVYEDCRETIVPWADHLGFAACDDQRRLIGPFNACLRNPAGCGAFLAFQRAEAASSSLSARVREVVILTVGAVWGSAYELYAHSAAGSYHLVCMQLNAFAVPSPDEEVR